MLTFENLLRARLLTMGCNFFISFFRVLARLLLLTMSLHLTCSVALRACKLLLRTRELIMLGSQCYAANSQKSVP
jgi:hypothetical protein